MDRFLKNNYYDGKHLSTDCFKTEQAYNSAKLAQMSRFVFGKGVICGFNVTSVKSYPDVIEIGSGAAIDDDGRLITMYDKIMLPVRTIEGFDSSEKKHAIGAVYREIQEEGNDTITEQCIFACDEPKAVELAEIIFENGKIESIRDTREPTDSLFLKSLTKRSVSVMEKQIDKKIADTFDKYLPDLVKNILKNMEESEKRIHEAVIKHVQNALEKKFEAILNKVKENE